MKPPTGFSTPCCTSGNADAPKSELSKSHGWAIAPKICLQYDASGNWDLALPACSYRKHLCLASRRDFSPEMGLDAS
jgi:hypothetical protein